MRMISETGKQSGRPMRSATDPRSGFTLVEVLLVFGLVGVLSAVCIMHMGNLKDIIIDLAMSQN